MRILITGGAGFIGTNVTLSAIKRGHTVLNVDCLSYAGSLTNLVSIEQHPKYSFEQTMTDLLNYLYLYIRLAFQIFVFFLYNDLSP